MNDDFRAERRRVTRLEELEAELLTSRRELGEEQRRQARLPDGNFQLLRVSVRADLALLLDVREWRAVTQALSEHPGHADRNLPPEADRDGGAE